MKPPHSLTNEELKEYAEFHLKYEINMLTWSVGILAYLGKRKNDMPIPWALNNGILNTYATHARNLIGFLYSRSQGKDFPTDIVIQDYVNVIDIDKHLVPISPLLEKAFIKANKQVVHLSKERIEYEKADKGWKHIEVMGHIRYAFSSIAPYIPNDRISESLKDMLSQKSVAVPRIFVSPTFTEDGWENGLCLFLKEKQVKSK